LDVEVGRVLVLKGIIDHRVVFLSSQHKHEVEYTGH